MAYNFIHMVVIYVYMIIIITSIILQGYEYRLRIFSMQPHILILRSSCNHRYKENGYKIECSVCSGNYPGKVSVCRNFVIEALQ